MTTQGHIIKVLLLTLAVGGLLAVGQCADLQAAKKGLAARDACTAALVYGQPAPTDKKTCHPVLVTLVDRARAADACDDALTGGPDSVSIHCTGIVQQVVIERKVALDDLARLQADQAAAITRAETRARNSEQRKTRNARIIQTAPRDGDGLIVCDARCLRDRAQAGPD
ncbi:hypothetical protein [Asticcacaulis sp. YBE204]|uniref:hypothetical protein n=1 Tax=Asticcacaulis sp. YBE204 TaxID=1282363 RepID=UPI0003C3C220|nr:hypothetical protein [Asticcacaulis sp. YBE204]ESQ78495.1 hypothetical protein AEYBE204_13150 [Asticcacaulis sp. YBE204]